MLSAASAPRLIMKLPATTAPSFNAVLRLVMALLSDHGGVRSGYERPGWPKVLPPQKSHPASGLHQPQDTVWQGPSRRSTGSPGVWWIGFWVRLKSRRDKRHRSEGHVNPLAAPSVKFRLRTLSAQTDSAEQGRFLAIRKPICCSRPSRRMKQEGAEASAVSYRRNDYSHRWLIIGSAARSPPTVFRSNSAGVISSPEVRQKTRPPGRLRAGRARPRAARQAAGPPSGGPVSPPDLPRDAWHPTRQTDRPVRRPRRPRFRATTHGLGYKPRAGRPHLLNALGFQRGVAPLVAAMAVFMSGGSSGAPFRRSRQCIA